MKIIKKILRIIAIILPCFCFTLISSNTYAKSYDVDSFLVHGLMFPSRSNYGDGFALSNPPSVDLTLPDSSITSRLAPLSSRYLVSTYNSSTRKCEFSEIHHAYTTSGAETWPGWSWLGTFIPPSYDFSQLSTLNKEHLVCRTMLPYGNSDPAIPEFDNSNVPFNQSINVSSMLPYNYLYNNLYFSTNRSVDGVDYPSHFYVSDMLNNAREIGDEDYVNITPYLKRLSFPLNFDSSIVDIIPSSFGVSGDLVFTEDISNVDFTHLFTYIDVYYFRSNYGQVDHALNSNSCPIQYVDNYTIHFDCNVSLTYFEPDDHNYFGITLGFRPLNDNYSLMFDNLPENANLTFNNFKVIINNDRTPGGYAGFGASGSFPKASPGYADVNASNADWFSSLSGLFNFSFLNPFSGLFDLFTNANSCVSIPVLASMLHSNETTYCPWFDSTVRNVLTPVLGISGMMLIFGFAVRWLSSSSGNMFEDQTSYKWGNTQIKKGGK